LKTSEAFVSFYFAVESLLEIVWVLEKPLPLDMFLFLEILLALEMLLSLEILLLL